MSPDEQVAENIYQLRNLHDAEWVMYERYPDEAPTVAGKRVLTPVDRLVDLGQEAVPQLIAALDDRSFTRSLDSRSMEGSGGDLRVGAIAQIILEHMSGRYFDAGEPDNGKLVKGTTREQAEAWWEEVQKKGEKQTLIDTVVSGGEWGSNAARRLVEKYPDAAIQAIEAGCNATPEDGVKCDYVDVASGLPGDLPVAFLKSKLTPDNGPYTQAAAAKALFARGKPDVVPAMIEEWRKFQPSLANYKPNANREDLTQVLYDKAGGLITFLAHSDSAAAIGALGDDLQKQPVEVRFAIVEVFLFSKGNYGGAGPGVDVQAYMANLPAGEAGAAIERLLVSELDDSAKRVGLNGNIGDTSYKDPRVCDMAAFVLSERWPDKYHFHWVANAVECDAQIAQLRDRWRSENEPSKQPD
jgi:hypothetical protein